MHTSVTVCTQVMVPYLSKSPSGVPYAPFWLGKGDSTGGRPAVLVAQASLGCCGLGLAIRCHSSLLAPDAFPATPFPSTTQQRSPAQPWNTCARTDARQPDIQSQAVIIGQRQETAPSSCQQPRVGQVWEATSQHQAHLCLFHPSPPPPLHLCLLSTPRSRETAIALH